MKGHARMCDALEYIGGGDKPMVEILSLYIHGFKNIYNTCLEFNQPITVLLAPNNYGKTNVLHAIGFAASLVGKSGSAQERQIRRNQYTSSNQESLEVLYHFEGVAVPEIAESVSFGVTLKQHNDSHSKTIVYRFTVSPHDGVLHEWLTVDGHVLIERQGNNRVLIGDKNSNREKRYVVQTHALVVSSAMLPDSDASLQNP